MADVVALLCFLRGMKAGRWFFFTFEKWYLSTEESTRGKEISGQILVQVIIEKGFKRKKEKETHLY